MTNPYRMVKLSKNMMIFALLSAFVQAFQTICSSPEGSA
jgi:hypothetical protein